MNFGDRVKKRRQDLGWTQEELAMHMGYKSKSTINKIELGINTVSLPKVAEFATALDTTTSYLMGWDKEDDDATLSDRLLTRYRELDDLDQAMVRRILKCDEDFNKV